MDYSPHIRQIRQNTQRAVELVAGSRLVLSMASRLSLSLCSAVLEPCQRLGTATSVEATLRLVKELEANLVLCTDVLAEGTGAELVQQLKAQQPSVRVLMIVTQPQHRTAIRRAIQAGCDGLCLEANVGEGLLLQALASTLCGGLFVDPSLRRSVLAHFPGAGQQALAPLTARECEVLQLAAGGSANADIARQLYVGLETVKSHMRHVLHKLQAKDRTHAAVLGIKLGFVDWPEPG